MTQDNSYLKTDKITINNSLNAAINISSTGSKIKRVYFYACSKFQDKTGKNYESYDLLSFGLENKVMTFLTPREGIWIRDFYKKNGVNISESLNKIR